MVIGVHSIINKGMLHVKTWVIEVRNVKSGVNLGLKVVMTIWVVITRVVIGVQISFSLSKGILHVKTWVIEVRNVNSGVNLGLKVVMTILVVITRVLSS